MFKQSTLRVLLVFALATTAAFTSGCVIEEGALPDVYVGVSRADVEVRWTIDGVDSAALCSVYGIQTWILEVQGPESRDVVLSCSDHYWSSENDLLLLDEGIYTVRITALDAYDNEIASVATVTEFFDLGYVDVLNIELSYLDFI